MKEESTDRRDTVRSQRLGDKRQNVRFDWLVKQMEKDVSAEEAKLPPGRQGTVIV